jgi:hypothetical protein
MNINPVFEKTGMGNEVIHFNSDEWVSFSEKCDQLGQFFNSDNNSSETALTFIDKDTPKWIVLNGDFRPQVIQMIKEGCEREHIIAFFKVQSKEFGSSWSNWVEESEVEAHLVNWFTQRGLIR